jgi:hypothetical protein
MSVERSRKVPFDLIYPKLDKRCRLCKKKLTGRQTSWCSKRCGIEAYHQVQLRRGNSRSARILLKRRDNEICAHCGVDCKQIKRIFDHVGKSMLKYEWSDRSLHPYFMVMRNFGFTPYKHSWEADHIKELRDGGEHLLENLQTLCIPCHKRKTKR